jgi:hypothetical protein
MKSKKPKPRGVVARFLAGESLQDISPKQCSGSCTECDAEFAKVEALLRRALRARAKKGRKGR